MDLIIYDLDGTLRSEEQSKHLHPKDPSKAVNWIDWQNHINRHGVALSEIDAYEDDIANGDVLILTSSQFGTESWLDSNEMTQPSYLIERQFYDDREPLLYKTDILHDMIQHGNTIVKWVDNDERVCDEIRKHYPDIEVVQV